MGYKMKIGRMALDKNTPDKIIILPVETSPYWSPRIPGTSEFKNSDGLLLYEDGKVSIYSYHLEEDICVGMTKLSKNRIKEIIELVKTYGVTGSDPGRNTTVSKTVDMTFTKGKFSPKYLDSIHSVLKNTIWNMKRYSYQNRIFNPKKENGRITLSEEKTDDYQTGLFSF